MKEFPVELIEQQPDSLACALSAAVNLFKLRGQTPPALRDLMRACPTWREGVLQTEAVELIRCFGFPQRVELLAFRCFSRRPDLVLKPLLRIGCHFILGYSWRHPQTGAVIQHAVVCDGYDSRGYRVLDSSGGYASDSLIEFEPRPSMAEYNFIQRMKEKYPHGSRRVLPYGPAVADPSEGIGLSPLFVCAFPDPEELTARVWRQLTFGRGKQYAAIVLRGRGSHRRHLEEVQRSRGAN